MNQQVWEREQKKEKPDDKLKPDFDTTDSGFLNLIQAIILGTYTVFNYNPTEDEVKQLYARMRKQAAASLEGVTLPDHETKEMSARLKVAEKRMLYVNRHCKGDASETGLVQFAQSIRDLDATRSQFPTHKFKLDSGKETECLIPFSSDIKFNLFIRDMSSNTEDSTNNNLTVYMKGAPERILNRCSKILIEGEEVEFTEELRQEV